MIREKVSVKPGDMVHIYHIFGESEYKDCEGIVKYIDDMNQIHGT